MKRTVRPAGRTGGFTLIELLVVVTIVVLVSAATLPMIIPAIQHRQISEAGRILQAMLSGAHDDAIRAKAPRGIRLLNDLNYPDPRQGGTIYAFNRIIPIETAPDYTTGRVSIKKPLGPAAAYTGLYGVGFYPSQYPIELDDVKPATASGHPYPPFCLMIEAEPYASGAGVVDNEPVNWWWNVRVGDKIRIADSGNSYTIIGPCDIRPTNPSTPGQNPELFVNVGAPGATFSNTNSGDSPLGRLYPAQTNPTAIQFLYVVNGIDDDNDGYVDNGWDGFDNNYTNRAPLVDFFSEWSEKESWTGSLSRRALTDQPYTIQRRPVPSTGGRATTLPANVTIDATTWNSTQERSRLPVDPLSMSVDVLLDPSGAVVPTTLYSAPTTFTMAGAFFHFWIAERQDVHATNDVWGVGNANPNTGSSFVLPMPASAYGGLATQPAVALRGERILITLFTRTGQIVSNSVEFFDATNVNRPFADAQVGVEEAK